MSSFIKDYKKYISIKIQYYYVERHGTGFFYVIDDIDKFFSIDSSKVKTLEVVIRHPTWYEIHEITRKSTVVGYFNKKKFVVREKMKDFKLKDLVIKFIDEDQTISINPDKIDQLIPELATYILEKIDEVIFNSGNFSGLQKEEEKELGYECFKYYSALRKKAYGVKADIPTPPAIVVLKRICEMLKCTPDEARSISKRDLESLFIAEEQEYVCKDPRACGVDPDILKKMKQEKQKGI